MYPVTSTKHVHLTSNFCNIELSPGNEDGTTINFSDISCGDTNKKANERCADGQVNKIDEYVNTKKDCQVGNNREDEHSNDIFCKVNKLSSSSERFDGKKGANKEFKNYTSQINIPTASNDIKNHIVSPVAFATNTSTQSEGDIEKEIKILVNDETLSSYEPYSNDDGFLSEEYTDENDYDEVFSDPSSTEVHVIGEQIESQNVIPSRMTEQAKNQKQHGNASKLLDSNDAIFKRSMTIPHCESPLATHSSDGTHLTRPNRIGCTNIYKRPSSSNGDVVMRYNTSCGQSIQRSVSEYLPVIVRRRGCTLRVRIASITEADLERLREVCMSWYFCLKTCDEILLCL